MFTTTMSFAARIPIFVALLLIHDVVEGMQITDQRWNRRSDRGGGESEGGGGEGGSPSSTQGFTSTTHTSLPIPLTTTLTMTLTTLPVPLTTTNISSNSTTPTPLPSSTNSPVQVSNSTTPAPLPSSTNSPVQVRLEEARHAGTIAGAVLGSVILAGLGLMMLTKCLSQARKARKRPRASTYFTDQSPQMSQTQNGSLLISSAPLVHHPVPIQFFNASPNNNNTRHPLSPLFPPVNSQDTVSPSRRRWSTSDFDSVSHAPSEPLQSPWDIQPSFAFAIPSPEKAVLARSTSSTSTQLSPLHRDMVEFQRALEVETDYKGDMSEQNHSTGDPPPKYIG